MRTVDYRNFEVAMDHRGVVTVTLDVPGVPLNVLTEAVMIELAQIVDELEQSREARLVVFRSGKESGFLAGADVHAIADIQALCEKASDPLSHGVQSSERAEKLLEAGQQLFARIEALPMPTLVVIHGVCLGGGLELSLACDYRVARNNSSTQIGLPEIKLGVIPGWGGTQRLPRQVGLSSALPMILKGDLLDAIQARRIGLIDRAIDPADWDSGVETFIEDVLAENVIENPKSSAPLWRRCVDRIPMGRWLMLKAVRRSLRTKLRHYPALDSALRAVATGFEAGTDGFAVERAEFLQLLKTPSCRHLLGLFFARERARQLKTWVGDAGQAIHDPPIRRIGVVGAGIMGAGIAQLASIRGFQVVVKEIDRRALEAGRTRIEKLIYDYARRKHCSPDDRLDWLNRIKLSCEESSLTDVDLVIEAAVEREDVKQQIFKSLDESVNPSAILTSNTSSLLIGPLASVTHRPHAVAGLHFFNPVHRMELVEVVRTAQTDDASILQLVKFVRAMGKTPILTADSPGFLVNRVLFPYLGEAVSMVNESMDIDAIDREARRFGMPMGPLELLDQVGIDIACHVAQSLNSILPGAEPVLRTLNSMVEEGHLGKKTGCGFYRYRHGKRGNPAAMPHLSTHEPAKTPADDFRPDALTPIQRRLVYPMLAEAIRCLEEEVVEQAWAIDLAMVLGTGFAPHLGGPLHLVDAIGASNVLTNMQGLQFHFDDRFTPPKRLLEMAARNDRFFAQRPDHGRESAQDNHSHSKHPSTIPTGDSS